MNRLKRSEPGQPCKCGAAPVRTIGAFPYCAECAEAFLEPIRERVILREQGVGFGEQAGPLRPDWGDGWADLKCSSCSATWTGEIGEACGYCIRWLELANDVQRKVLLWPDLPPDDDARRKPAMVGWVDRLADAVKAEIVTHNEALTALRREERRHVA